jgi:hypothetical protein
MFPLLKRTNSLPTGRGPRVHALKRNPAASTAITSRLEKYPSPLGCDGPCYAVGEIEEVGGTTGGHALVVELCQERGEGRGGDLEGPVV